MVNIVNMDLPKSYMEAIVQTQIAIQKIQETTYLKEGIQIQSQTDVNVATVNKELTVDRAKSQGEVYKKVRQAQGEALKTRADNMKGAYNDLATNAAGLGYTAFKDKLFVHYIMVIILYYIIEF